MRYYKWRSFYSGDGDSREFLDVLPEELTLNDPLPKTAWCQLRTGPKTLFQEVVVKHAPFEKWFIDLAAEKYEEKTVYDLFDAVKAAIMGFWEPSKKHIIGHSSGSDSRLIGTALRDLRVENGEEWWGDTTFVETLGETDGFKEIMKRQGFDKYLFYNEGVDPSEFYEWSLKFDRYYTRYNGMVGFPVNMWYDAYKDWEERGVLSEPDNTQFVTGYGSNELDVAVRLKKRGLIGYFRNIEPNLQLQFLRSWAGEIMTPFWEENTMRTLAGIKGSKNRATRTVTLAEKTIANHLNDIERGSPLTLRARGYRTISPRLRNQMQKDYDNSWYGKLRPCQISNNFFDYHESFGHYGAASLCEHLLEKGYKIKGNG